MIAVKESLQNMIDALTRQGTKKEGKSRKGKKKRKRKKNKKKNRRKKSGRKQSIHALREEKECQKKMEFSARKFGTSASCLASRLKITNQVQNCFHNLLQPGAFFAASYSETPLLRISRDQKVPSVASGFFVIPNMRN